MKQMLSYRTDLLAQTGACSVILLMALRSSSHQSLNSSISASMMSSPQWPYPNKRPWITGNIRTELKGRAAAFKELDSNPEAYKKSCYALWRIIKQAKHQHRTKIESFYIVAQPRAAQWPNLPEKLIDFYACFEASNTETCMRTPAVPDDCVITLSLAVVIKTFKNINIHKTAGPDGLPGRVLRAGADQQTD